MKQFQALTFNRERCYREALELRRLLSRHRDLKEKEQIQPFFEKRPHLSAFLGCYSPDLARYDLLAYQYPLFGDFACDVVVGDSVKKAFCFVEFEDARPRSLFVRRGMKATREWSPRFDHGFSQLIDWFYKLHDMEKSDDFHARFGARSISFRGVLVVGRDAYLRPGEKERLEWRRNNVAVRSQNIQCVTFDGLLDDLTIRLQAFRSAEKLGG